MAIRIPQATLLGPGPPPYRVRLANRLRLMRPYSLLWFVSAPVVTMALWLRGPALPLHALAPLLLSLLLGDAGLTTLNDIADVHTDRASVEPQRYLRPLAAGSVSIRGAYVQVVLLEAGALIAALAVSPVFLALLGMGVLYGIGYSVRPVYAGGRPIVSQAFWLAVWVAMYGGVYIGVGGDLLAGLPYIAATVLFMGVGETLAKDLRDIDNDALTGKRTTPVVLGVQRATLVSAAALVLGSLGYVAAAATAPHGAATLVGAVTVVVGLWCGRVLQLARALRNDYVKDDARVLHVGCIRVFLTINLLLIVALSAK
jgi:4-hydroxybenzoate polyprenyltransferase